MKKFRLAIAAALIIAISVLVWGYCHLTKKDFREVLLYGDEDAVALRIFLGADVNAVDESDNAPLDYAMVNESSLSYLKLDPRDTRKHQLRSSNAGVVRLVLKAGADANRVDELGDTPMLKAARDGDSEIIKVLLSHGANVNFKNGDEDTALMEAMYADPYTVEVLIKGGADVDIADKYGDTPLLMAVHDGDVKMTKTLLSLGANVNQKNHEGESALMHAMEYDVQIVEDLIEAGADVNAVDNSGDTVLAWAFLYDQPRCVEALLKADVNLKAKDRIGLTPFELAMDSDHPEYMLRIILGHSAPEDLSGDLLVKAIELRNLQMIKELIENKIDVNAALRTASKGRFAFLNDYETAPVLALLLNAGWDAKGKDEFGNTALAAAMSNKDPLVVTMLLNAGVDVNQADANGSTPLCSAIQNHDFSLIMDLLHRGALVDSSDYPLHLYLGFTNDPKQGLQVVGEMLDRGAKVNMKDEDGFTPLLRAMSTDDCPLEVIKLLVAKGADVNAVYTGEFLLKGNSPLILALERENDAEEAIKCLLDAGADPMHKPYGEETVIEYAERHYEKLVPLLKNHKPTAPKKR